MAKNPAFVILAAGKGTRLGGDLPKPLTKLPDGRSILQQQLDNIEFIYGEAALAQVYVVVGHRAEDIVETLPRAVKPVHNEAYDSSNTAFSLNRGLSMIPANRSVIWMNGDVVFSPLIFDRIDDELTASNFMAVVPGLCGEEEMKYSLVDGLIQKISKENSNGLGEAVGINQITAADRHLFSRALKAQRPQAYFEAGIQETIRRGMAWLPLDTTGLHAMEIDFAEDLRKVNEFFVS